MLPFQPYSALQWRLLLPPRPATKELVLPARDEWSAQGRLSAWHLALWPRQGLGDLLVKGFWAAARPGQRGLGIGPVSAQCHG